MGAIFSTEPRIEKTGTTLMSELMISLRKDRLGGKKERETIGTSPEFLRLLSMTFVDFALFSAEI